MTNTRRIVHYLSILMVIGIALAQGWFAVVSTHAQGGDVIYDFERGDVGDWITRGQVTVVSQGVDPQAYNALSTVAQGNFSVRIGDEVPYAQAGDQVSSIEREIIVPTVDTPALQFSYAVVADDPPTHSEQDKPSFRLEITDLTTNETLPVSNFLHTSQNSNEWYIGNAPSSDFWNSSFRWANQDRWVFIPWRHEKVDLSGRTGHRLRISFVLSDCNPSAHAAYGYLDNIRIGNEVIPPPLPTMVVTQDQPLMTVADNPLTDPGPFAGFLGWVEQNKIWPFVICLIPLLLLLLTGFGSWRIIQARKPEQPIRSYDDTSGTPRRPRNQGKDTTIRGATPTTPSREAAGVMDPNKRRKEGPKGPDDREFL